MRVYSRSDLIEALPYSAFVSRLSERLLQAAHAPQRHVHSLLQTGQADASLLLMPAWNERIGGVKIVNVTPGNAKRGLPAVAASYLVFDAETGAHLALLDGEELTARRTAAVAAVAAERLAVDGACKLLIIGSGRIASELAFAYRAIRTISQVCVFSPTPANAENLVRKLDAAGFTARVCMDIQSAVADADIIACATLSRQPIVRGEWLRPGQHVALIGGFTPDMREADDEVLRRAAVWVDGYEALTEAGDLTAPLSQGILQREDIMGSLPELCAAAPRLRRAEAITVFKSVGNAAQDLAAAQIALESLTPAP